MKQVWPSDPGDCPKCASGNLIRDNWLDEGVKYRCTDCGQTQYFEEIVELRDYLEENGIRPRF